MKIQNFSVTKFRSFLNKATINLDSQVIIVGPNNGGKSTISDALDIFLSEIRTSFRYIGSAGVSSGRRNRYSIERDYPKSLVGTKGRKWPTEFEAEFVFDDEDIKSFKDLYKFDILKNTLKVTAKYDYQKERILTYADKYSNDETIKILTFISTRYKSTFIPAIRDGEKLNRLLNDVIYQTLKENISATKKLTKLQNELNVLAKKHIETLNKEITQQVKTFLDSVKKIDLDYDLDLTKAIKIKDIQVDDGSKTSITLKGDGTKNLLLLGHLTATNKEDQHSSRLIVIEEPESHLNSSYLYSLKSKIDAISNNTQVIITTHSPVFVDLFGKSTVYSACNGSLTRNPKKSEIASLLGVKLGENLSSNDFLILTEGIEDEETIKTILKIKIKEPGITKKIDFLSAYGAGNIHYLYQQNKNFYKKIIAILDNDLAGNTAVDNLKKIGCIDSNIFLVPLPPGFKEHEFEDLISLDWTLELLSDIYGRSLNAEKATEMRASYKTKFSNWIVTYLKTQSVPTDSKDAVKSALWDKINQQSKITLSSDGESFIDSLTSAIQISKTGS